MPPPLTAAQAAISEVFDMSTPVIPDMSYSCSALASPAFSDFVMDTTDLHTTSLQTEEPSYRLRTVTPRKPIHSFRFTPEPRFEKDPGRIQAHSESFRFTPEPSFEKDPGRIQAYSESDRPRQFYNINGTMSLILDDLELSSTITEEDKNIRKLNCLRDYYKSRIRELPPLHATAAAVISNVSSRAAGVTGNSAFEYHGTIEVQNRTEPYRKGRKRPNELFNPQFNSTTKDNEHLENVPSKRSKMRSMSMTSDEKTQVSWKDHVSLDESTPKISTSTYRVDRSKRSSKSNKSLQTMLTMENVSKLSEIFETVNRNQTYRLDDERIETFRLTKSMNLAPLSSWSCRSAEECFTPTLVQSDNCDMTTRELTEGVRARVVNWLVKLDEYTGGGVVALQCAVRFLDYLAALEGGVMPGAALACGAACFWVASKLQRARAPGAACIVRHCGGAFTVKELLACERRVLARLAFPAAPVVPADEVERLAEAWHVQQAEVTEGAHYLCCCALLHARLAAAPSMQLAGAALAVSLQLLAPQHPILLHLDFIRSDPDGWHITLEHELASVCRAVSSPACACREPFLLYSSRRRRAPALRIASALHVHNTHVHSNSLHSAHDYSAGRRSVTSTTLTYKT